MVRPHGTTFGIESAATDRACASNRTLPPDENDIEFINLDPKASFKITGEQIDGAFTFEGIDYLLEARWQSDQIDPAALDVFDGKIRRKLENTLGLFVAINGFSDTAVGNHSRTRPTMILMDGADLWAVLERRLPRPDLLRRKRRHAAQTGEIVLHVSAF
jgi:hypothetical protein